MIFSLAQIKQIVLIAVRTYRHIFMRLNLEETKMDAVSIIPHKVNQLCVEQRQRKVIAIVVLTQQIKELQKCKSQQLQSDILPQEQQRVESAKRELLERFWNQEVEQ